MGHPARGTVHALGGALARLAKGKHERVEGLRGLGEIERLGRPVHHLSMPHHSIANGKQDTASPHIENA